jgi:hypothetical protein
MLKFIGLTFGYLFVSLVLTLSFVGFVRADDDSGLSDEFVFGVMKQNVLEEQVEVQRKQLEVQREMLRLERDREYERNSDQFWKDYHKRVTE